MDGLTFLAPEIVHVADVAGTKRRDEDLFDIEMEALAVDGPSISQGASIRSWRGAARKVVVFQWPCGTLAMSLSPSAWVGVKGHDFQQDRE